MTTVARIFLLATVLATVLPAFSRVGAVFAAPEAAHGRVVSQHADDANGQDTTANAKPSGGEAMSVFSDIEKGWKSQSVDLILKHYPKGKVAIVVDGSGPSGGKYSRSQSYYLFKDLFKYTITRKFEFVQFRKPEDESTTSFAVAERQYQRNDDGRLFKDKIYVSLQLEDGQWVVSEIKSIR